jgi:hypothetical protein
MLEGWHEFYAARHRRRRAGGAAVRRGIDRRRRFTAPQRASATRTFMSPVVFHYTNVLFLSLIALIPTQPRQSSG